MKFFTYTLEYYVSPDIDPFVQFKNRCSLKVHKHEILFEFFAETETLWSQGPVTRDF
jgi:hypothetical protein